MKPVEFRNLYKDKSGLIYSDLIEQELEFNSTEDLILVVRDEFSRNFVESKFKFKNSKKNQLYTKSNFRRLESDVLISAEIINQKTNDRYELEVFFDSKVDLGTLKMSSENPIYEVFGSLIKQKSVLYTEVTINIDKPLKNKRKKAT